MSREQIITYSGSEPEVPGIGPFLRIMEKQLDILKGLMDGPLMISEGTRIRTKDLNRKACGHRWFVDSPGVCRECGYICPHEKILIPMGAKITGPSGTYDQTMCAECGMKNPSLAKEGTNDSVGR